MILSDLWPRFQGHDIFRHWISQKKRSIVIDLDWPLNASSPLSASAELLVESASFHCLHDVCVALRLLMQLHCACCISRPPCLLYRWHISIAGATRRTVHHCTAVRSLTRKTHQLVGTWITLAWRTVCYRPRSFAVAGQSTWNAPLRSNNELSCFIASWRLKYILEHIILISTLVTVFTVGVGEHNFNVIIIIIIIMAI